MYIVDIARCEGEYHLLEINGFITPFSMIATRSYRSCRSQGGSTGMASRATDNYAVMDKSATGEPF